MLIETRIYVNHSNNNNEKNVKKRKRKKGGEKRSIYKHVIIFFLFTNNENKNSKYIQGQKFNKHSCTKDSPEHDFICQSGSYAGLP